MYNLKFCQNSRVRNIEHSFVFEFIYLFYPLGLKEQVCLRSFWMTFSRQVSGTTTKVVVTTLVRCLTTYTTSFSGGSRVLPIFEGRLPASTTTVVFGPVSSLGVGLQQSYRNTTCCGGMGCWVWGPQIVTIVDSLRVTQ